VKLRDTGNVFKKKGKDNTLPINEGKGIGFKIPPVFGKETISDQGLLVKEG